MGLQASRIITAQQRTRVQEALDSFQDRFRKNGGKDLWEHQNSAIASLGYFFDRASEKISLGQTASGAIVMPTGAGKTVLAAEIVKSLGLRAMILAPTVQILLQHDQELTNRVPDIRRSIYYSDRKGLDGQVIISTYSSAMSLFYSGGLPGDIDIVFYDEAHRSLSPKRFDLHRRIAPLEIGLTATPAYNEDKHILKAFDGLIYEMDLRDGIELGVLAPLRSYVIETNLDLKGVRLKRAGELLDEASAEKHLNVLSRNNAAMEFYLDGFKGAPAVAFCITKKHAEEFDSLLRSNGVKADFIHSDLSNKEREKRLNSFENGDLDVIASRDILVEGWDSKRVLLELNLRPTYSRVVKTHMLGRVLRVREGKEAGIAAEFQDIYKRDEQPLLVQHLFDEITYRQGGLVAAPPSKKRMEEQKLEAGGRVDVIGDLSVSYAVKNVVSLNETSIDYRDRRTLKRILLSRKDVDIGNLTPHQFFGLRLDHPFFHGTALTLMHKAFGIRSRIGVRSDLKEDYLNFISYIFDDMPPARAPLSPEETIGLTFGEGSYTLDLQKYDVDFKENVRKVLATLTPREEGILKHLFGIGLETESTVQEVAKGLEVGYQCIRDTEARAIRKLRHPSRSKRLRAYAGEMYAGGFSEFLLERELQWLFVEIKALRYAPEIVSKKTSRLLDIISEIDSHSYYWDRFVGYARTHKGTVVPALIKHMDDQLPLNPRMIELLGEIKDPSALPRLTALLDSDIADIRIKAIRAIGGIGDPSGIPILRAFADRENEEEQKHAIAALGEIGKPAVPTLISLLDHRHLNVRIHAIKALGDARDASAVKPLIRMLKDGELAIVTSAVKALGDIADPSAIPDIIEVAERNEGLKIAAIHAFLEMEHLSAAPILIKLSFDKNPAVQKAAIRTLGEIADLTVLEDLQIRIRKKIDSAEIRNLLSQACITIMERIDAGYY